AAPDPLALSLHDALPISGLDAVEGAWDAAAAHARQAVSNDPSDAHAWRVLATAEYVLRRDAAALDAWNHIGEPSIDLIDVKGLRSEEHTSELQSHLNLVC